MRIVSYNILDGGTGRADPLAEVLLAQRSDIVCLIEAQDLAVVERIAKRLNMDFCRAGDDKQAAALLSRWPIRETIDHGALREGVVSRSLLEAVVTDPGGVNLPIGIVHLPPGAREQDETAREPELSVLLDIFERHRREKRPHVLAGDFNSNAPYQRIDPSRCKPAMRTAWDENGGSTPRRVVQKLLDTGYVDTLRAVDEQRSETEVSFTTQYPGQRVDYIFSFGIQPARIRSAWIEQDRLAKYASDHYPVGAEIELAAVQ